MIGPKVPKQTPADMADAYEHSTLRDNYTCQMCKQPGDVQRDHRQNRQQGNTVLSNLLCLCLGCHKRKTENPAWAYQYGWGVPRWAVPADWPVPRMIGGQWVEVLLDDVGGWEVITEAQARAARSGDGVVF